MNRFPLQKEIWLVRYEQTSLENRKIFRPYLIISNNLQNQYDEEVIGLPLTTQEVGSLLIGIPIEKLTDQLLEKKSWVLVNRIHSMNKEIRLVDKLGTIDEETWTIVLSSLWKTITN